MSGKQLTADQVFTSALDAEFEEKDVAKAITLYEAAAVLYDQEGRPTDAIVARFSAETAGK